MNSNTPFTEAFRFAAKMGEDFWSSFYLASESETPPSGTIKIEDWKAIQVVGDAACEEGAEFLKLIASEISSAAVEMGMSARVSSHHETFLNHWTGGLKIAPTSKDKHLIEVWPKLLDNLDLMLGIWPLEAKPGAKESLLKLWQKSGAILGSKIGLDGLWRRAIVFELGKLQTFDSMEPYFAQIRRWAESTLRNGDWAKALKTRSPT